MKFEEAVADLFKVEPEPKAHKAKAKKTSRKRTRRVVLPLLLLMALPLVSVPAQDALPVTVVGAAVPFYPALARQARLQGIVRL